MTDEHPIRRSQAERRAETIELIVKATLDAITEVGLRNTTTGEICRRAGVSVGAMFHHFDTRLDVIVASVEHHMKERLARYRQNTSAMGARGTDGVADPRALIRMLRSLQREPGAVAWLEVVMETRTDPELRARIKPILERQRRVFRSFADRQPGLQAMPLERRNAWLELLRNVLHGESLWEHANPQHDLDEPKLDALLDLAVHMGASRRVAAS